MSTTFYRKRTDWGRRINRWGIELLAFAAAYAALVFNVYPDQGAIFLQGLTFIILIALCAGEWYGIEVKGFKSIWLPILFFVFICFQLVELPWSWLKSISPHTAQVWGDHPLIDQAESDAFPISLCAIRTVHQLQLFWIGGMLTIATCSWIRTKRDLKLLCQRIVQLGILTALVALAHQLFGNRKIYWSVEALTVKGGTFRNYSILAEFLIICSGFGLILSALKHQVKHTKTFKSNPLMALPPEVITLLTVSILAIIFSGGRMGIVTWLFALALTVVVYGIREKRKHVLVNLLLSSLMLIAALTVIVIGDISGRFSTFGNDTSYRLRMDQVHTFLEIIPQYPMLGVGLGATRFVYPAYSHGAVPIGKMILEADVWYLQLFAEVGLIGVALVLVMFLAILSAIYSLYKRSDSLRRSSYGFLFILIGLTCLFATDFGMIRPPVFVLLALCIGCLMRMPEIATESKTSKKSKLNIAKMSRYAFLFGAVLISGLNTLDSYERWEVADAWRRVERLQERYEIETVPEERLKLLSKMIDVGDQILKKPSRELHHYYDWFEYRLIYEIDKRGQVDDPQFTRAVRRFAYAAPAYYKNVSAYGIWLYLHGDLKQSKQMLELASDRMPFNRLTLLRLSLVYFSMDDKTQAQKLLGQLIELKAADRVFNFLFEVKRMDVVLELLDSAPLHKINHVYTRAVKEAIDPEIVKQISAIYIQRCQKHDDALSAEERCHLARHYRNLGQYQDAITNLNQALKHISGNRIIHWRKEKLSLLETIKVQDEAMFMQLIHEYEKELRFLVRVNPGNKSWRNKLAEIRVMIRSQ